ncbi:hypothetical protein [Geoalkalibacter halelectricus]|uniref:hypothetical protein n=1 Tax=Geoalkalibacter halelectricus TaxID=2847045 RepID=UPI003D258614
MGLTAKDFHLSEAELEKYQAWAGSLAEEDPDLAAITISFTFSSIGTEIVAHRGAIPTDGKHLVIRDIWEGTG